MLTTHQEFVVHQKRNEAMNRIRIFLLATVVCGTLCSTIVSTTAAEMPTSTSDASESSVGERNDVSSPLSSSPLSDEGETEATAAPIDWKRLGMRTFMVLLGAAEVWLVGCLGFWAVCLVVSPMTIRRSDQKFGAMDFLGWHFGDG